MSRDQTGSLNPKTNDESGSFAGLRKWGIHTINVYLWVYYICCPDVHLCTTLVRKRPCPRAGYSRDKVVNQLTRGYWVKCQMSWCLNFGSASFHSPHSRLHTWRSGIITRVLDYESIIRPAYGYIRILAYDPTNTTVNASPVTMRVVAWL